MMVDVQTDPPWGRTNSPRLVSSNAFALEPERGRMARSVIGAVVARAAGDELDAMARNDTDIERAVSRLSHLALHFRYGLTLANILASSLT
jgi:hypothetical protein